MRIKDEATCLPCGPPSLDCAVFQLEQLVFGPHAALLALIALSLLVCLAMLRRR